MKPNANQLNISDVELLEYINKAGNVVPERPEGFGITAGEYCGGQKPPVAFSTGRRVLSKLVAAGKLKQQRMKQNGHIITVYHK